jgi:hypothetical protein
VHKPAMMGEVEVVKRSPARMVLTIDDQAKV